MTQAAERNFDLFEWAMVAPLEGKALSPTERYVADLLLAASSAKPLSIRDLIRRVDNAIAARAVANLTPLNDRGVKALIRTLRRDHALPILSSRHKPAGYWWCGSTKEMEGFIESFRSQALDELTTLAKVVRHNYPELAGQLTLEDAALEELNGQ